METLGELRFPMVRAAVGQSLEGGLSRHRNFTIPERAVMGGGALSPRI